LPPRESASKKTVHASEQDRPDVAERRKAWRHAQNNLVGRLIFLDETWTTTAMTRRYAWADVGARILFLPPYSPDLNPIEMAFAKFKELLRQAQARTVESLWGLIGRTLNLFTPEECANYVRHCGYNPL
jgi:transposase